MTVANELFIAAERNHSCGPSASASFEFGTTLFHLAVETRTIIADNGRPFFFKIFVALLYLLGDGERAVFCDKTVVVDIPVHRYAFY